MAVDDRAAHTPATSRAAPSLTPAAPERYLDHLQRMAMLGSLTSGIGHDLRNLAMPALLRLDVLAATPNLPASSHEDIAVIRRSMAQLQRLAGGLRLLTADPAEQHAARQTTSIESWWHDVRPLVEDALGSEIELEAVIAENLPNVAVPPSALAQVLLALVLSSGRALESIANPRVTILVTPERYGVRLSITDNGAPIDDDGRRGSFAPLFASATAPRTIAVGLGLAAARAMMVHHGGAVESEPSDSTDTTIVMRLPADQQMGANGSAGARQRVALTVRDARIVAWVRSMVAASRFDELTTQMDGDVLDADVIVCDADAVADTLSRIDSRATVVPRVIAIGRRQPPGATEPVTYVDPMHLSSVVDLLR